MIKEIKGDIMVKENREAISSLQIPRENPGHVYASSSKIEKLLFITEASSSEEYDEESTQCY